MTIADRSGRVLVIDDNAGVRAVLRRVLPEHEVVTVEDGLVALTVLASGKEFDLVLCDVVMPRMGGVDFWESVASLYPTKLRTLVFITGGGLSSRDQRFLECVPAPVLEKPFSIRALREVVDRFLFQSLDADTAERHTRAG